MQQRREYKTNDQSYNCQKGALNPSHRYFIPRDLSRSSTKEIVSDSGIRIEDLDVGVGLGLALSSRRQTG